MLRLIPPPLSGPYIYRHARSTSGRGEKLDSSILFLFHTHTHTPTYTHQLAPARTPPSLAKTPSIVTDPTSPSTASNILAAHPIRIARKLKRKKTDRIVCCAHSCFSFGFQQAVFIFLSTRTKEKKTNNASASSEDSHEVRGSKDSLPKVLLSHAVELRPHAAVGVSI